MSLLGVSLLSSRLFDSSTQNITLWWPHARLQHLQQERRNRNVVIVDSHDVSEGNQVMERRGSERESTCCRERRRSCFQMSAVNFLLIFHQIIKQFSGLRRLSVIGTWSKSDTTGRNQNVSDVNRHMGNVLSSSLLFDVWRCRGIDSVCDCKIKLEHDRKFCPS